MSKLTLFLMTIISLPLFGQNEISGVVVDSLTKETIPFANISYTDQLRITSDFNGVFQLGQVLDSTIILKVNAVGYYPKVFKVKLTQDSLRLTLNPIPLDEISNFIIWGKPTDTIFYKNVKIQKINYTGGDVEEFYLSGQIKFVSAKSSTRSWFENGQLKSQSILKNNHYIIETTWYPNGQKKSEGTLSWGHKDKKNEGEWKKNNDWKYWTENGKEKNNR